MANIHSSTITTLIWPSIDTKTIVNWMWALSIKTVPISHFQLILSVWCNYGFDRIHNLQYQIINIILYIYQWRMWYHHFETSNWLICRMIFINWVPILSIIIYIKMHSHIIITKMEASIKSLYNWIWYLHHSHSNLYHFHADVHPSWSGYKGTCDDCSWTTKVA